MEKVQPHPSDREPEFNRSLGEARIRNLADRFNELMTNDFRAQGKNPRTVAEELIVEHYATMMHADQLPRYVSRLLQVAEERKRGDGTDE
jgi:hypothetical protein